jgi:hypothetical protein
LATVVEVSRTRPLGCSLAADGMLWKVSVLRKLSVARVGTDRSGFVFGPELIWRGRS